MAEGAGAQDGRRPGEGTGSEIHSMTGGLSASSSCQDSPLPPQRGLAGQQKRAAVLGGGLGQMDGVPFKF